jgi:hypothetical protein
MTELLYPRGTRFRVTQEKPPPASPPVSEADFQSLVVETAALRGWRTYHTFRSDHSEAGFPDLCCVRGRRGDGQPPRLLFAEIKKIGKAPTMAQVQWLLALAAVPGVETYAWDQTDTEEMLRVLE